MNFLTATRTCLVGALWMATCATAQQAKPSSIVIHSVNVSLPTSTASFPPGVGSDIAGKCLICHSAGMVLRQPALSKDQWTTEINKMRSAYGAPILDTEVDTLSTYFTEVTRQGSAH